MSRRRQRLDAFKCTMKIQECLLRLLFSTQPQDACMWGEPMEHLLFLILFLKLNHRNKKIYPPLVRQDFETKMKLAQTILSRRDSLKIARRFNAGNGSACASSPAGTAGNARSFRSSLRDAVYFSSQPGVKKPGYGRSSLQDKTVARNGGIGEHTPPACGLRRPAANVVTPFNSPGRKIGRTKPMARRHRQHAGRVRSPKPIPPETHG